MHLFLCVIPGEWDLPWPIFGSKDQCSVGADYHARLWQGKTQQCTGPPEKLPEIIALIHTVRNSLVTGTHKQTQRHIQSCSHERAQMPRACYSSGLSKRGTKSMQHPRGVFPSRTPSQFSTKAYRNSACYAISLLPSRLQHRIMGSPGKDNQW